ncbi:MAG: phosphoribosyl-ATP diphosphatase [Deltaproteobacteria bacterium]|nr:phosphoribosyl-ATP diphosphatase [Deltaproteobacteria bacterium]
MIIPSIDIMSGRTVQLVGGREKALDAGDPVPLAQTFRLAGEIAVIDLDAAIGGGENSTLIRKVIETAPCRVGGGIRSVEKAIEWLDAGASKVILGTAARREVLERLPKERVIAALDAEHDAIVVEGWRKKTGERVVDRMKELRDLVGGFLVTFVEREGRLGGIDLTRVKELADAAGDTRLTVAGGVTTVEEVAVCDRLGVDAQVGMAIYTGKMNLADAIAAPLVQPSAQELTQSVGHPLRGGEGRGEGGLPPSASPLWPTVVCDERGVALGLAWSDRESLREAVRLRRGVYHSRRRGLWTKGETSGDTQELTRIDLDCDRDAIRFTVRQHGTGFCHTGTRTCWGPDGGFGALFRLVASRIESAPPGSYTKKLLEDPALLKAKILEEAGELGVAATMGEVAGEAADVIYFTLVAMANAGVTLEDVERVLDRRSLKVTRRPGDAKNTQ